jgi:hypothetical protein
MDGRCHNWVVARRWLLPPVAAAVCLALAGCGSSSDPQKTVVGAANKTLTGIALSDLTLRNVGVLGRTQPVILGRGVFDFATGLGFQRIDLPGGVREFLDYAPATFWFQRRTATGAVPFFGKEWVGATLTGPRTVDRVVPRFVEQTEALGPQLLLDEIVWGAVSAKHIGDPVVDHVPLSHYRVTVDLKRALAAASGPSSRAMRLAIADELRAGRSRHATVDVWVDGAGRVARLQSAVPGSGLGTVAMALSDYGSKLAGGLPPASDVFPVDAATRAGAASLRLAWIFGGS